MHSSYRTVTIRLSEKTPIGLSELSDYYRSLLSDYRTRALGQATSAAEVLYTEVGRTRVLIALVALAVICVLQFVVGSCSEKG